MKQQFVFLIILGFYQNSSFASNDRAQQIENYLGQRVYTTLIEHRDQVAVSEIFQNCAVPSDDRPTNGEFFESAFSFYSQLKQIDEKIRPPVDLFILASQLSNGDVQRALQILGMYGGNYYPERIDSQDCRLQALDLVAPQRTMGLPESALYSAMSGIEAIPEVSTNLQLVAQATYTCASTYRALFEAAMNGLSVPLQMANLLERTCNGATENYSARFDIAIAEALTSCFVATENYIPDIEDRTIQLLEFQSHFRESEVLESTIADHARILRRATPIASVIEAPFDRIPHVLEEGLSRLQRGLSPFGLAWQAFESNVAPEVKNLVRANLEFYQRDIAAKVSQHRSGYEFARNRCFPSADLRNSDHSRGRTNGFEARQITRETQLNTATQL